METTSLKFEDRLDGASNFLPWKVRFTLVLKENDFWEIVDKVVPSPTYSQQLVAHGKNEISTMWVILM
jgi:hypothetical protein